MFGGDVVQDRLAGQARGERLSAVALLLGLGHTRWERGLGDRLGLWSGLRLGLRLRQDFLSEEQELSGIDPLALPAIALAEELFELMLEFGVEMNLLAECLQKLADELMGRLDVVWEWVGRGDHTPNYVDVCSFVGANFSEF